MHKTTIFEAAFFPETPGSFICALLNRILAEPLILASGIPLQAFFAYFRFNAVFI
jgi:hypothetical protein